MRILKSSVFGKGKDKHYHLILAMDDGSTVVTPGNDGHVHEIMQEPEMGAILGMAGMVPHAHAIAPYDPVLEVEKEKDEEVIKSVLKDYRNLKDFETENLEKGREAVDFYKGKQWNEKKKREVTENNRAALTINKIGPQIDELCGYERQERQIPKALPVEDSDQIKADIANMILSHVLERSSYNREKSKVFFDTVVPGRGLFNVYMDMSQNIEGEVKVEKFPWDQVLSGPHEKEDLADCDLLIKYKWYTKEKLESLYPDKKGKIQKDMIEACDNPKEYYNSRDPSGYNFPALVDVVDTVKKEYRLIERWKRVFQKNYVLMVGGDVLNITAFTPKDRELLGKVEGVKILERDMPKMRITRVAGKVVLSDLNPADLPANEFFIVPSYCYKIGDEWFGKVEWAKDPQRDVNKRYSQAQDIANRMVASGWLYDDTTFPNSKDLQNFKATASSPGFVAKVSDVGRLPYKVESGNFPRELVELIAQSDSEIRQALNVTVQQQGANESAQLMMQKLRMRLTGNEFLFDNISFAQKKVGQLVLAMVQKFYSPERIAKMILSGAGVSDEVDPTLGGQPLSAFTVDDIVEFLQDTDLTTLNIVIDESAASPTARIATLSMLSEMAKQGMPIPPDVLVGLMDTIPAAEKRSIQEQMAAQAEADAAAADSTRKMEITKTLIGQGVIPPDVQAEFMTPQQPQLPDNQMTQVPQDPGILT